MKKYSLVKKIVMYLLIIAIIIICITGIVVSSNYKKIKLEQYKKLAYSYAKIVSDLIDCDKAEEYAKTLKKDEYYYEINNYLDAFEKESDDIWYAYVIKLCDRETFMYIWDGGYQDGVRSELGSLEKALTGKDDTIEN